MSTRRTVVAVIPPGLSLNAMVKVMAGIGVMYPKNTLFLATDDLTGGTLVLHDPDAAPAPATRTKPQVRVSAGKDQPGDLLTLAMAVTGRDDQAGAKALAVWLAGRLEAADAANYLTYTVTVPGVGEYGVTIQRGGGKTPGERIHELEQQVLELSGATG